MNLLDDDPFLQMFEKLDKEMEIAKTTGIDIPIPLGDIACDEQKIIIKAIQDKLK